MDNTTVLVLRKQLLTRIKNSSKALRKAIERRKTKPRRVLTTLRRMTMMMIPNIRITRKRLHLKMTVMMCQATE